MALLSRRRSRPDFPRATQTRPAPAQASPGLRAIDAAAGESSANLGHPRAQLQPDVTRDRRHDERNQESRRHWLGPLPPIGKVESSRDELVAHEVHVIVAIEEPVARVRRDKKTCKRPFDGEKRGDEGNATKRRQRQIAGAALEALSDEIQCNRRHDEQRREIHRNHVTDVMMYRYELRLSWKQLQ